MSGERHVPGRQIPDVPPESPAEGARDGTSHDGGAGAPQRLTDGAPHGVTEGGDPVCWLDRLCEECGAMREDPATAACRRCGTPFTVPGRSAPDPRET
ncbi:hypothetical protein [Actinacidiphila rubida]|uniref:Uncharacterized protein n=1 Tax=Actinacidiphila rubida TaxID=310780 RepID=A0A1H8JVF5_9ACTN|nr:hypothetical protein [Actinacidiphila rubida]SEN84714.1 hypothetical protein SAMN05216267_101172 [Actinacidiphila rubida]